jgi:hypothetical protein
LRLSSVDCWQNRTRQKIVSRQSQSSIANLKIRNPQSPIRNAMLT